MSVLTSCSKGTKESWRHVLQEMKRFDFPDPLAGRSCPSAGLPCEVEGRSIWTLGPQACVGTTTTLSVLISCGPRGRSGVAHHVTCIHRVFGKHILTFIVSGSFTVKCFLYGEVLLNLSGITVQSITENWGIKSQYSKPYFPEIWNTFQQEDHFNFT